MARTRTFIAVSASPGIRQAAQKLAAVLRPAAGDVKWVAPENLHWTLQFLGDVDELEIPALCSAVSTAVADLESFDVEARGAGAFPAADRPRTLWLGAGDSFAGAMMGYLAQHDNFDPETLKTAMAYGILVASFNVEGFGLERMQQITRTDIEDRMTAYRIMLSF